MSIHVFLKYLIASVLSMAAVRLANMADAALVGNIVGAEGLAGITLCQPVMQVLFSLYTLFVLSSSVLMGMAIGKGDDTDVFILNTDDCFYEFFRIDTDEVSEPLLLSQLEEGATYCLIITNDAGIYRLYNDFQITVKKIKYDVVEITCQ